ncbi:MAG: hypothetical protein LBK61_09925 [Spirochaetaceae bacterium]|nr:hypothetical protein [Spirochaetaceae bacterium]
MANKKFLLGMLATVLAFSMAVAGCESEIDDVVAQKITITVTGVTASALVINLLDDEGNIVAADEKSFSIGSATFSLKKQGVNNLWTGTGSYVVILNIVTGQNHASYIYTEGKEFSELGVSGQHQQDMSKLPKYSISRPK